MYVISLSVLVLTPMYIITHDDPWQALYFDRYTRLLAPELDPLRDARVSFPRSAQEAMQGRRGAGGGGFDEGDVIIDVSPR